MGKVGTKLDCGVMVRNPLFIGLVEIFKKIIEARGSRFSFKNGRQFI